MQRSIQNKYPTESNVPPFNVHEGIVCRMAMGMPVASDSVENAVVSMGTSGQEWKLYAVLTGCVLLHFLGIGSVPVLLKPPTFVA